MTRTMKTTLKSLVLVGLAVVFCTKLPSNMDKLAVNISPTLLVSPPDGSTDNILSPVLAWESVSGATRYSVQVSTVSDFSAMVYSDTAVTDTFTAARGLKYKTIYYWRVQVHDARSASDWSEHRIFTTIIEPQMPAAALPKDSLKGASTTLTLTWNSASGAASYCVEVATDTGFASIVAADSTLADTAKVISNLLNNTTYYWRVRSQNPGGASVWAQTRTFTTIVAAPKSPVLSAPVNGALDQQLSLTLAWGKVTEASGYYLQVATDIAFTNVFVQDSSLVDTTKAITSLANGVAYYWRVKARNDGGASAWSLVSGFTTFSAAPQQPVLSLPADNAASQTIPLTLVWNRAVGSATYHLQVAADSGFAQLSFIDSTLTDTSKSIGGLANSTKYFWRVRAKNPSGVSAWSLVRGFTTFSATLATPMLRSPADGSTAQLTAPVLGWQGVSGATKYRIQVSVSSDFSTIFVQDSGLTDTSKTLAAGALANSTMYYWRVRAENASGLSNWASPWRFTTVMAAPQVPVLVSPPDGATGQQLSLTLTWNKAAGTATYRVQVANDTAFGTIVAEDSTLTDTSKVIAVASNNTTYYWRVSSKNVVGTSGWSGRRSFTTFLATLQKPVLTSPLDGATDLPVTPTLSWSTVAGASTYEVQVSVARDFTSVLIDDATLTIGSKTVAAGALSNSTSYYWRVMAKSLGGASNWTDPWGFTTIITTPATPGLVAPSDNAVDQPVSLSLTWNKATGAATYYVQVASDTGFATIISNDSTLTDTTKAVSGLSNSTTYYWKVKAKNASGYGSWCGYRKFTTIIAAPPVPALTSPATGATNVDVSPQLAWTAVTGAAEYHIQVSTATDFGTGLVVDDSTYTQTTKLVGPLSRNTVYFWHVKAKNIGGASAWSDTARFTTVPAVPGAPALVSPADAATGQPVPLTLVWSKTDGATMYYVTVATDAGFTIVFKTDSTLSLTDTSIVVGGLAGSTTYYWRVRAKNATAASAWSADRSFTTITQFPLYITGTNGTVTRSPNQLSYDSGTVVSLTAGPSGGYQFVGWSGDLSGSLNPATITMNATRNVTASFATIIPQPPVLTTPANNVTNVHMTPTLTWSSSLGANHYILEVSSYVTFLGGIVVEDSNVTGTSKIIGPLTPGVTYYWHIQAVNSNGTSNWSTAFAFSTFPLPAAPVPVSPSNDTLNQPVNPTISWSAVSGAVNYNLQVSTHSDLSVADMVDLQQSALTYQPTNLSINTKYYWRVRAINTDTTGAWSPVRNFTTAPAAPGLLLPNDLATGVAFRPVLSWNGSTGANTYRAQVSTASDFGSGIAYDDSTIAGTTTPVGAIGPLSLTTKYYWRVRGKGTGGVSAWSGTRSFTAVGLSWTQSNTGLTDTVIMALVIRGSSVFAGTATKGVFRSSDWGASWTAVNIGLTYQAIQCLAQSGSNVYAGTNGGGLFHSADNGASWTEVDSGFASNTIQALAASGDTVWAGTNSGGVYFSAYRGTGWTAVNSGLTTTNITSLLLSSGNLYAGTNGGGLFISTNYGGTWTPANTGLTNTYIQSLVVSGGDIFAGTWGGGVYVSGDNGTTWTAANSGLMGNSFIQLLCVGGSYVFVGTWGGGTFSSANNGTTWTVGNTGNTNAYILSMSATGNTVIAGTNGGGVYISPLQ